MLQVIDNNKTAIWIFLIVGISLPRLLFAQDIQFSQFYGVPTYQNPAFAGSTYRHRVTLNQRFQWTNLPASYNTTFFSYDGHISAIGGGLGVTIIRDYQGGSKLISNQFNVQYATEVPLSSQYSLRMGLQTGAASYTTDYSQYRYSQDYTDQGYQGNTVNQNGNPTFWYWDITAGLLLYSEKLWVGVATDHLNQPVQTFYNNQQNRLPIKYSVNGGYRIKIKNRFAALGHHKVPQGMTVIPTFNFKSQGNSTQLDLGIYGQMNMLLAGIWYRGIPFKHYQPTLQNNESMVFLVGIKYLDVAFTYSYDITVSNLVVANTGGSHELNFTLYFDKIKKSIKKMRRLPCPDFL
jgi:type IX secretion system PorP/SprF family membrane protein